MMGYMDRCLRYCAHYEMCAPVLAAFREYEKMHAEKHPAERALMSFGDPPACLIPKGGSHD